MKSWRMTLALLTVGALALPAPAGILFGKKTKPNPAERVPELIVIVKTDKDESKRVAAAEELRQYDPAAYTDIVPVLIDVLMNDSKPAVRAEAAESLGKLRPVSQEAGWALEQAQDKDSSWRVRTKARYVLMTYHWAGYHTDPKLKDGPAIANPKDQPPEKGKVVMPAPGGNPTPGRARRTRSSSRRSRGAEAPVAPPVRPTTGETPAPPLADPAEAGRAPPLPPGPSQPRPVITGPVPLPPIPVPTKLESVAAAADPAAAGRRRAEPERAGRVIDLPVEPGGRGVLSPRPPGLVTCRESRRRTVIDAAPPPDLQSPFIRTSILRRTGAAMNPADVLTIHTDGAARGNPGPAAFAYVIARDGEPPIEEGGCLGRMTNNQAEYTALVRALEHAARLGDRASRSSSSATAN